MTVITNLYPNPELQNILDKKLLPLAKEIDQNGFYPGDLLKELGTYKAYGIAIDAESGGLNQNLTQQIGFIADVAKICGSTAFLVWCQTVCAWYLHKSDNLSVKKYLQPIINGELLAGTGMSNTVKHLAGIERINLQATSTQDGYIVNGTLPWVSNLATGHLLIAAAHVQEGGYVMFAVKLDTDSVSLRRCPDFAGMSGTGTYNIHFKNALINSDDVLADSSQFDSYIQAIKPGFLLSQIGMGAGLIQASLDTMQASNKRLDHVNKYLINNIETISTDFQALIKQTNELALYEDQVLLLDILRTRAQASELTLTATQAAALHTGASGYIQGHPAQRRLREALFVAIVTPALKHLRKEIFTLEHAIAA